MDAATTFRSILWRDDDPRAVEAAPEFFGDLGLDKIVADVIGGKYAAYDLAPFFHAPLDDPDAIVRRQHVLRDLERRTIKETWDSTGHNMSAAARALGLPRTTLRDRIRKYGWR